MRGMSTVRCTASHHQVIDQLLSSSWIPTLKLPCCASLAGLESTRAAWSFCNESRGAMPSAQTPVSALPHQRHPRRFAAEGCSTI